MSRQARLGRFPVRELTIDRWTSTIALAGLWLGSAIFVGLRLNQGWVPHDEGTLAQSAQRVLDGELPHRDFAELYTGGLTFLNAAMFEFGGENLIWLRVPLFILFVVYVPCIYALARRFASPVVATLIALLAVAWGLPTYPAAVPSWYLLFLACFGTLALVKHQETRRSRWLVVAGVLGGVSICFKIVGIWYVLAALLYLIFLDQHSSSHPDRAKVGAPGYRIVAILAPLFGLALVIQMLRSHLGAAEVVNLLLPVAAVCLLVALNERGASTVGSRERFGSLLRSAGPFLAGVAAPIGVLLVPYLATGSIGDLLTGTLITPQSRLQSAYASTPTPLIFVFAIPVIAIFAARCFKRTTVGRAIDRAAAGTVALVLVTGGTAVGYLVLWFTARGLAPCIVVIGAIALAIAPEGETVGRGRRTEVFLLLVMAAFAGLVQFPFSAPIYFCFVVPLMALAGLATLRYLGMSGGLFPIALLVANVVFGFAWLGYGNVVALGSGPASDSQTVILDHRRASLRVSPREKAVYQLVTGLLEKHSTGRFTFAGPDTPELYVLSGLRNPTRSLFDTLDPSDSARGGRLVRTLQDRGVTAIVINLRPKFSRPLEPSTISQLRIDYPHHLRVDSFDVRWRKAPLTS